MAAEALIAESTRTLAVNWRIGDFIVVFRRFAPGWFTVHRFLQRSRGEVTKYVKLPCDPREADGKKNSRFLGQTVPKGTRCEFPDWLDAGPMELCSRDSCNSCVPGPQCCHYRLSTT